MKCSLRCFCRSESRTLPDFVQFGRGPPRAKLLPTPLSDCKHLYIIHSTWYYIFLYYRLYGT